MEEQMTKSELLELIQGEHQRLEATLSELDKDQMIQPGVVDHWSVKDTLAHIAVWEKRMVRWVGEAVRGRVPEMLPPGMTWDDLDEWNEQTYQEHRDRPLAGVLADFERSYQEALQVVQVTPEKDLVDPNRFEWLDGEPLWRLVAANTFWHYREHDESIRAWLEGNGTV